MNCLLGTHTYIWLAENDNQLSDKAKKIFQESENVYLSIGSIWEIVIKKSLGKLEFNQSVEEIYSSLDMNSIKLLNISQNHLVFLQSLPFHHRDPFDRIIISQAISEDLTLISKDRQFENYNVKLSW